MDVLKAIEIGEGRGARKMAEYIIANAPVEAVLTVSPLFRKYFEMEEAKNVKQATPA